MPALATRCFQISIFRPDPHDGQIGIPLRGSAQSFPSFEHHVESLAAIAQRADECNRRPIGGPTQLDLRGCSLFGIDRLERGIAAVINRVNSPRINADTMDQVVPGSIGIRNDEPGHLQRPAFVVYERLISDGIFRPPCNVRRGWSAISRVNVVNPVDVRPIAVAAVDERSSAEVLDRSSDLSALSPKQWIA